jgi:ribosomal protein S18 acetylase RimI-like enzyme
LTHRRRRAASPVETARLNMPQALMNERVTLRPQGPEDEGFLYQLYASTRDGEMAVVPWDASQREAFLRMQFDLQTLHYRRYYPDADFQVVLSGGRPVGRLYVHRGEEEIRIVDIALLPECRGAGIGGGLIRDVQAEAGRTGKRLTIHVERTNPALRLYRRLGFRLIEDKGIYLFMEWRSEGTPDSGVADTE